jgi:hypothetical protein
VNVPVSFEVSIAPESSAVAQISRDRVGDGVLDAARFFVVEAGRRSEERPEQPPAQLKSQGVRGGHASRILVAVVIAGSRDELLHLGEPVLKLPDVESVEQRAMVPNIDGSLSPPGTPGAI